MSAFSTLPFESVLNKSGAVLPSTSLHGKYIGLYFSAHWCGPCRNFTPVLAKKYSEIIEAGHNFEIVFVSADEDEESADGYFQSMPWTMIPFSNREAESTLSSTFDVKGIPTLVILNPDGSLLTSEGRQLITTVPFPNWGTWASDRRREEEEAARKLAEAKASFRPSTFFGADGDVVDGSGAVVTSDQLQGKLIGVYFSAHWCPPCRRFTPVLAEKYRTLISEGKPFEIIFVSSDRDEASAKEYFSEMPWKCLTFAARDKKAQLSNMFEIEGIPSLVLVSDEKGLISLEGREAVMTAPFEQWTTFDEDKRRAAEELQSLIDSFPETVTIDAHPHPLTKLPSVYRGSYGCDICSGSGNGWVYHCEECSFDVHPQCAVKVNLDKPSAN